MEKCIYEKKFIDIMVMKSFSEMTIKSYSWHWDKFTEFKKGVHVTRLSSQDINDYLVYLNSINTGDSFFNQAINAIRFFFTYSLNKKIKDYMVVRPKKAKTLPILLDDNELQLMFDNCHNLKHKCILSLLFSGGLRVSEVINLKQSEIDPVKNIIFIRAGKGKKDRLVGLNPKVWELIQKYYSEYNPIDWVFNGQFRGQYTSRSIEQFIKDIAKKSGIKKKVHPHLFRHQFITMLLENKEDIYTAQLLAGHSKTATTIGYGHLRDKFISSIQSPISSIRL